MSDSLSIPATNGFSSHQEEAFQASAQIPADDILGVSP